MSSLLARYLSQPAKRCSRCGSEVFRLTPAGALCCLVCSPGESSAILVARNAAGANQGPQARLTWQQWAEDFDGPLPAPAGSTTSQDSANPETLGGRGRGVAGGGAAAERTDPPAPAEILLAVSPRLDWFAAPAGSAAFVWCERADFEIVGEFLEHPGWPAAGVYRRLTQAYFGWLCGRVESARAAGSLRGENLDAAREALGDIALAAFAEGILGMWAIDPGAWPRQGPAGYLGPRPGQGGIRLIVWDDFHEDTWERAKAREPENLNQPRTGDSDGDFGSDGSGGSSVGRTSGGNRTSGAGAKRAGRKPGGGKFSGKPAGGKLAGFA